MRRGRIIIYLALIVILGSVAGYFFLQGNPFQQQSEPDTTAVEPEPVLDMVEVVVITQNTPRGTIIDETLLTTIEIPRNEAVEGIFFSDLATVVGRRAKFDLDSGIPLTASMLVDSADSLSETGSLAALNIPRGKVAVSIPISRLSGVSYAPRPGDHVSVIVTMMFVDLDSEFQTRLPNEFVPLFGPLSTEEQLLLTVGIALEGDLNTFERTDTIYIYQGRTELDPLLNELLYVTPGEIQRGRLVSQMLLSDTTVLQVGDFEIKDEPEPTAVGEGAGDIAEPAPPVPEDADVGLTEDKPPDVITLIVNPQDAVTLNYLMVQGAQLTLALRATGDESTFSTESATLQYVLDEYNITLPAKLPYGVEPRVDELTLPVLENDLVEPEE
jgi:pilus assembly protein CpaB